MKAIKITAENAAAIELVLHEANGRSTAHAYTTFGEIADVASGAEKALAGLMLKKDFSGAVWRETSGGSVPNSYKGIRNGTAITIERRSAAWYLVSVSQVSLFKAGGGAGRLQLTTEQDAAAVAKLRSQYSVKAVA